MDKHEICCEPLLILGTRVSPHPSRACARRKRVETQNQHLPTALCSTDGYGPLASLSTFETEFSPAQT
jgi:hypothetical protein